MRLPSIAVIVASVAATAVLGPARSVGQVAIGERDTTTVDVDSGDIVGVARVAQARFERRRIRLLPLSYEPFGGSCDEIVGRICTTYGEGEWYPLPEDPEIVTLRGELIAQLDSLQTFVPDSDWILGQRVWYRAEGGDWQGALEAARSCGSATPGDPASSGRSDTWWCAALEGFAEHGLGRFEASEAAFERALELMDEERARRWRVPRWPIDGDARDLLEEVEDDPEAEAAMLDRLWTLADPLWLVEGDDRLTAHYARWTFTVLREGARNPFRLSWGDDLRQLTVRHGWQVGWERVPARDYLSLDDVIGHQHPLGRDYMPRGETLEAPERAPPEAFGPDVRRPRSLYAPEYAPVLLPMGGQLAVFPRETHVAVVATHHLPEDTTYHAGHRHPLPWLDAGEQADMPDRTGLFAYPVGSGTGADRSPETVDAAPEGRERVGTTRMRGGRGARLRGTRSLTGVDGTSMLEVPTGDWVVSAESWSPARRRAGRLRTGVEARPAPPDVATLSDLLLLRPATSGPESLEEALHLALPRPRIRPGQTFAIGWEVVGLGFRPETLLFEVSVERTDRGVLSRIGDFLGLSDRPRPLALSWEEPGPSEPGHVFRYLSLDLPGLEEGEYEIRLVLRTANRSDAVSTRAFDVVHGD